MATHLVMGDPHCTPKASNDRFLWAGRVAADYKVSHVICMGDFCCMDSLSSYDRGKKSFEGRRYQKDMSISSVAEFDDDSNVIDFLEFLKKKRDKELN